MKDVRKLLQLTATWLLICRLLYRAMFKPTALPYPWDLLVQFFWVLGAGMCIVLCEGVSYFCSHPHHPHWRFWETDVGSSLSLITHFHTHSSFLLLLTIMTYSNFRLATRCRETTLSSQSCTPGSMIVQGLTLRYKATSFITHSTTSLGCILQNLVPGIKVRCHNKNLNQLTLVWA